MNRPARPRTLLFLQGPPSRFWTELGDAFAAAGHRVLRVNLSAAERLFWRRPGAVDYRGSLARWPAFLAEHINRESVTDVLYYADRHPYHVAAAAVAAELGATALALEFGYLRPDWITLERNGMSAFSGFPRDPAAIRAIAASVPEPDLVARYRHTFPVEAAHEVVYGLSASLLWPAYPRYQADRPVHPIVDYLSWVPRLALGPVAERRAKAAVARLLAGDAPLYLYPLQLATDYQVRDNAPFGLREATERVIRSFAAQAPAGARLVVKLHPLDNGLERWGRVVRRLAAAAGVAGRVVFIDGGDLAALLARAAGVVTVNSTVGLQAIVAGRPVIALGAAIYDVPGLVFDGELDAFWTEASPPDRSLAGDLVRALAATIQVKGSFYDPAGRKAAIAEIVRRVAEGRVNEPGAFVDPPPRLAKARRRPAAPA